MQFHFLRTKRKGAIVDAKLQWGGRMRQGFDVLKLALVLGGIDLPLRRVSCLYIFFSKAILENSDFPVVDVDPCLLVDQE